MYVRVAVEDVRLKGMRKRKITLTKLKIKRKMQKENKLAEFHDLFVMHQTQQQRIDYYFISKCKSERTE
jgi:hypothetical protein